MQMIEVSRLIPHPLNHDFFDDMVDGKWEDFKDNIKRRGVIAPITITQDYIIVAGHQRVKACQELGLLEVPYVIHTYPENDSQTGCPREDMILEDLISTNILQRGIGNINPIKVARCIIELQRIKGIHNGGDRKSDETKFHLIKNKEDQENYINPSKPMTQADLATDLHITQQQLRKYTKLLELIPELQDMVESGEVNLTVANKVLLRLSPDEQKQVFDEIGRDAIKQSNQKELEGLVLQLQELRLEKEQLKEKNTELLTKQYELEQLKEKIAQKEDLIYKDVSSNQEIEMLKNNFNQKINEVDTLNNQIKMLKEQKQEIQYIDKEVEVDNPELIKKINMLEREKELLEMKAKLNDEEAKKYRDLKNQIDTLTHDKDDVKRKIEAATSLSGLVVEIENLIKTKLAPIKYSKALTEAKDSPTVIKNINEILSVVESWCNEIRSLTLDNTNQNYIIVDGGIIYEK